MRSASPRQYLASEVKMPKATDAMLQMLKVRPADPVHALSKYLIRWGLADIARHLVSLFTTTLAINRYGAY